METTAAEKWTHHSKFSVLKVPFPESLRDSYPPATPQLPLSPPETLSPAQRVTNCSPHSSEPRTQLQLPPALV